MMKKWYILNFPVISDPRGDMAIIQEMIDIPFAIKRIFYQYNTSVSLSRGNHANRNSKFVFVSVSGKCSIKVNDGINNEYILLDSPNKALYVDSMVWKEIFGFSNDNVLLVISNELFDSKEYIRNYDDYKRIVREEK